MVWYAAMMGMWQGLWDENMSRLWGGETRHSVPPTAEPEDPAERMSEMRSSRKQETMGEKDRC